MDTKASKSFKRDLKRLSRRKVDFSLLDHVIRQLQHGIGLDSSYRNHKLEGEYHHFQECHITPDWILIYRLDSQYLHLERTGSHSDLFK